MAQDAGVVRAHRPVDPQPAEVFTIAHRVGSPRRKAGFFLSMKWMLLLVLVVIGVGTLMGTTATPVL